MPRITGGEWRGRILKAPRGDAVRPTQDMVREALFSMIRNDIAGAKVLDLYAGSGAVGLDALSRGAAGATFVDAAKAHLAIAKANAEALGAAARSQFALADAERWVATAGRGRMFDFAYADPPYALGAERRFANILAALASGDVVRPGGCFAAEMKSSQTPDETDGWTLCRDRRYGQTRLAVYVREKPAAQARMGAAGRAGETSDETCETSGPPPVPDTQPPPPTKSQNP